MKQLRGDLTLLVEPSGEWHFGIWKTRRCFSLRLFKWAFVFTRAA